MEEIRFGNIVFIPGMKGGRYPFCNSLYIDDEKKVILLEIETGLINSTRNHLPFLNDIKLI